ncbi:MAG: CHASE2 domain-containing protein [Cyanobacteria bacterium P01_A01_bin.3]
MSSTSASYRLMVQQVNSSCFFQLNWGTSQQLTAALPYPKPLTSAYNVWRHAYLSLYRQPDFGAALAANSQQKVTQSSAPAPPPLRGRAASSGQLKPATVDRQASLAKAEATMLHQFQRWLRSSELYEIRAEIARAALELGGRAGWGGQAGDPIATVDISLTCTPLELERLPWEAWELGEELAPSSSIRIARYPLNVRAAPAPTPRKRSSRMRVLAIMGDETGLDFAADRRAVKRLAPIADIHFVGYQPGVQATDLKTRIITAISDDRGWDIVFFAGHSTEAAEGDVTGGDLSIAPGTIMSIGDLVPHLKQARQRGLQFAIFNSCCGLTIARACIDAGLSQVAIAREPIHNSVAQEFLCHLLQRLAAGDDAHTAVKAVSQWFKLEKTFTYPSAHLLPSFFRHPNAEPFRFETLSVKQRLIRLLPDRTQAMAVAGMALVALLPAVQDGLLQNRTFMQAIYRDVTGQLPAAEPPPVVLVQIERESIARAGMANPYPMDRQYLARLVDRLSAASFPTIGLDYLLDRPQVDNDPLFAAAVQEAVRNDGTWMVLASISESYAAAPATEIAPLEWTLRGDIYSYPNYVKLPWQGTCYDQTCPFAYVVALSFALSQEPLQSDRLIPHPERDGCLQSQLVDAAHGISAPESTVKQLVNLHQSQLTSLSGFIGQLWMQPIVDFSLPPERVYTPVPAWRVLSGEADLSASSQQIALIAPGGYPESGIEAPDYFPVPAAMDYWRNRQLDTTSAEASVSPEASLPLEAELVYTGAEAHAYSIHHLLKRHMIIPIPDVWMVGLAAAFGKWIGLWMVRQQQQSPDRRRALHQLGVGNIAYAALSLQLYISGAVMLPVVLPSITVWILVLKSSRRTLRE